MKKLFVSEGAGAGVVDRPIRLSSHLSSTGEKRSLTESDLRTLAAKRVKQALRTGERPITEDEQQAVTDALAQTGWWRSPSPVPPNASPPSATSSPAARTPPTSAPAPASTCSPPPASSTPPPSTPEYARPSKRAPPLSSPPANAEEARALAKVGPLLLSLLPGPEKLDDMDAYHVVIAASRVGSDSAVSYLAQFVEHPWPPVRSELLLAWPRFDSAECADEVVAHLDPAGLQYTVRSDDQLDQLERLAVRPEGLIVRSGVSCGALATYLGRHSLQAITFASEATLSGLDCLRGQSALHTLDIDGCPDLTDLSAIGGLPIRRLNIATGRPDLDLRPVAQLGHLEVLTVDGPAGLSWSPRSLPPNSPLQGLLVRGATSPVHGLDGLGSLPAPVRLVLNAESSPASAADWQEVRALRRLGSLRVSATSIGAMPAGMTLPGVNSLTLDGTCGEKVLRMVIRRLPLAFPGLGECRLPGRFTPEGDTGIDIGPLGGLPGLKEVQILASRDRVRGAELLPPSARVFFG
ncbi:hypothetical protein L8C58_31875 [Streptomyces sp. CMAA1738]|nr:hypothetical protein [Streptomyces sp. CMAA1738]MEC4575733.1 hypothetical protein [Streptomyces sp. CMAA1738]